MIASEGDQTLVSLLRAYLKISLLILDAVLGLSGLILAHLGVLGKGIQADDLLCVTLELLD